ncbi:glycogen synthase GlgA [Arthrobacter citreus]|nr:glycogen synthase GlgA [Arthrobacter citreus]
MVNVLYIVSECVPFVKSGGLADVAGALPKYLNKLNMNVRVMLPFYSLIPAKYREEARLVKELSINLGWRKQYCGLFELKVEGTTYYFIDNEYYFNRDKLYGHYDDGERYAFFSLAAIECIKELDFIPDVIHCHDWHTAMIPFFMKEYDALKDINPKMKSVFTIHNLQFQGVFSKVVMDDILGIDEQYFSDDYLKFYDCINFMKAGIISSDIVTTVSPTYKEEIKHEFFGEQLDGLLREQDHKLFGIVNGIDETIYNPATDQKIHANYDEFTIENKAENKLKLQESLALKTDENIPVIAMVSRLTSQKGIDLITHVFPQIMDHNVQVIILGTGEEEFENFFKAMEHNYYDKVRAYIGFDESFAHQIYAGADLFLMPSLFEPCGLGQLIAMKYGCVPIVRETGGLNDTVQSYNEETKSGNGFTFTNFNAHDMLHTIERGLSVYEDKKNWKSVRKNAINRDSSWLKSAKEYAKLYMQSSK